MLAIAGGTAAITYLLGNNSGTQHNGRHTGSPKNLIQNRCRRTTQNRGTTARTKPPVMEERLEPFNPFPQDPEDDNFKLF
ncbi:MAG: hypothetical protein CM15mP49_20890 [Actinomycetota bacterium]|nr:MAG: hypothetical protein CM15mP49_20890 [Actinomycetota bacterium]